ncbi:unnamed protein product, partial [Ectocarpus sp. 12 AP-2014]
YPCLWKTGRPHQLQWVPPSVPPGLPPGWNRQPARGDVPSSGGPLVLSHLCEDGADESGLPASSGLDGGGNGKGEGGWGAPPPGRRG